MNRVLMVVLAGLVGACAGNPDGSSSGSADAAVAGAGPRGCEWNPTDGGLSGACVSDWVVTDEVDPVTDKRGVKFIHGTGADQAYTQGARTVQPAMAILCGEGTSLAIFATGLLHVDGIPEHSNVTIRFDSDEAQDVAGIERDGLLHFATANSRAFSLRSNTADRILLRYRPISASQQTTEFDVSRFKEATRDYTEICGF